MLNDIYFRENPGTQGAYALWWPVRQVEDSYISISGRNLIAPAGLSLASPTPRLAIAFFRSQPEKFNLLMGSFDLARAERDRTNDEHPWSNLGSGEGYLPFVDLIEKRTTIKRLIDVPGKELILGRLKVLRINPTFHDPVDGTIHGKESVLWA